MTGSSISNPSLDNPNNVVRSYILSLLTKYDFPKLKFVSTVTIGAFIVKCV